MDSVVSQELVYSAVSLEESDQIKGWYSSNNRRESPRQANLHSPQMACLAILGFPHALMRSHRVEQACLGWARAGIPHACLEVVRTSGATRGAGVSAFFADDFLGSYSTIRTVQFGVFSPHLEFSGE